VLLRRVPGLDETQKKIVPHRQKEADSLRELERCLDDHAETAPKGAA